nr:copia protein [Tanacetum cinerariifolium]
IVQICLWIIDSGCSKHMMGNRALLTNFVEKFLGTVRFGNNDFVVIAGYGDVVIGSMTIKKVNYVEDLLTGNRSSNLYTIALNEVALNSLACLIAKNAEQNGVVERRNQTLVEAARTMLTFANLPMFLWAEAIAAACFTQNRLIINKGFDKTPYELMNKRKPNIKFFHVFGCRCYLLNNYDDVGKLKTKRDIKVLLDIQKSLLLSDFTTNELESYSSFLNDDVHQGLEEVAVPSSNTQSVSSNMVPNVDEASIDYDETFLPVARIEAIRLFLAYAAHKDFTVFQMYVKTAFLNRILKDEVYVGQPPGFVSKQYPGQVYALDKALYGLKQAPQA